MSEQDDLARRRAEAQAALGGEKLAERAAQIEKRRQEARQAMEDESQRERRQTREKAQELAVERREKATAAKEAAVAAEQETKDKLAAAVAERERKEAQLTAERQENAAQAAETTAKIKEQPSSNLSAFHTIKTDMAKAVREQGLSLSKIATLSRERGGGQAVRPRSHAGIVGAFIFVLLAAGGFVAWWWLQYRQSAAPAPIAGPIVNSIMRTEVQKRIEIGDNANINQLRATLSSNLTSGSSTPGFANLYLTRGGEILPFSNFRESLGLQLPEILTRHLSDNYLYGYYDNGEARSPFLIIQTNFADQAWPAMLGWETYMSSDLAPILQTPSSNQGLWSDKLLRNRDIRQESDPSGNITLVYGFVNDGTILITKNEATYTKVFERLIDQI